MKFNVWTALLVAASAIVLVDRLQEPLAPAAQACAAVLKAVAAESEADARSLLAALELSNSTAVGSLLLHAQPALLPAVSALRSARSAAAVLPGLSPALALVRSLQLSPAALAALSLVVAIAFVAVFSAAYAVFFSRVSLSAEFANAVSRKQPPAAFPTGWFAVSSSADLKKKDVRPVVLGGQHLVLFRGEDGKAAVLDAYCPHLGAHLAVGGLVSGNTVVCPFHGWAFRGNDGVCTHIPYCDNVPTYTKTNAWPVAERDGLILVWHDVDGQKPLWEPAASGASSSLAVTHGHAELTVAASIQELREGLVCLTSPQRVLVSNWLPGLTAQFSSSWTAPADSTAAASGVSHLTVRQSCSWFGVPVPLLNVTYTGTFAGPGVLSARASTWAGPVWLVDAVTPVQSLQQKHFALAAAHVPVPRFVAKFVLLSWAALQAHIALQWTRQSRASVQPVRAGSDEAATTVTAFREWMASFAPKSGKKKKEGLDW